MSTLSDSLKRLAEELEALEDKTVQLTGRVVDRIEDLEQEVAELRRRIDRTDDKLYEIQTEFI